MHSIKLMATENISQFLIKKYDIIEIITKQTIIDKNKIQSSIKIKQNEQLCNLDYTFVIFVFQNRNLF